MGCIMGKTECEYCRIGQIFKLCFKIGTYEGIYLSYLFVLASAFSHNVIIPVFSCVNH